MIVSDSKKFVFVHIPKCAGNTVRGWLRTYDTRAELFWGAYTPYSNLDLQIDLSHLNLPLLRAMIGAENFDRYYKFAVIRNPYDRAYSSFVESLKFFPAYQERGFKAFLQEKLPQMDFDQLKPGGNQQVHFTPQYAYIFDANGEQVLDQLCRIEKLEGDLRAIAYRLGLDFPDTLVSQVVRAPQTNGDYQYMDQYDRDSIQVVNAIYQKDFELLGFAQLTEPLDVQAI